MSETNQGIIVSGGSFNAGQIAIGDHAQAIQNTYNLANAFQDEGKDELASSLKDLLAAIEAHRDILNDYDEISNAIHQIAEETKKDKPSKISLKGLLDGVKDSVGTVADIAQKVGVLQKAIAVVTGLAIL